MSTPPKPDHAKPGYDYDGPEERETLKKVRMTPAKPIEDDADAPPAWRHKGGSPGKKSY